MKCVSRKSNEQQQEKQVAPEALQKQIQEYTMEELNLLQGELSNK